MLQVLNKEDITEMLYGAAFLSTGAGGPLSTGISMLESLEKEMEIKLMLADPKEMENDAFAATAIGFGSPDAFKNADFGIEALYAFEKLSNIAAQTGKKIKYLCSIEMAGFNTFTPMYVAMKMNLPILDIDLNGKSIPELSVSLASIYKYNMYPLVMANCEKKITTVEAPEGESITYAEKILLEVARLNDMRLGISYLALSREDVINRTIPYCLSKAKAIGKAILESKKMGNDLTLELKKQINVREIFNGRLVQKTMLETGKFNTGTFTFIDNTGKNFYIDFKNEILIARDEEKVILTVPDIVAMVNVDAYEPITCSEAFEGMNVKIFGLSADDKWHSCSEGFEMYKQCLDIFGYKGGCVKFRQ